MKNIAHFMSGLALASFVPGVMEDAARGSLLIALGGLCAMLPDTFDFKFVRYLERADAAIVPDVASPDAQTMADQIAEQMWLAVNRNRARVVHLHPARRSVSEWVLYSVRFDAHTATLSSRSTRTAPLVRRMSGRSITPTTAPCTLRNSVPRRCGSARTGRWCASSFYRGTACGRIRCSLPSCSD